MSWPTPSPRPVCCLWPCSDATRGLATTLTTSSQSSPGGLLHGLHAQGLLQGGAVQRLQLRDVCRAILAGWEVSWHVAVHRQADPVVGARRVSLGHVVAQVRHLSMDQDASLAVEQISRSGTVHHAFPAAAPTAGRKGITRGAAPNANLCHLPLAGAVAGPYAHEARGALPGSRPLATLHRIRRAGNHSATL